jgi:hypothetical protein
MGTVGRIVSQPIAVLPTASPMTAGLAGALKVAPRVAAPSWGGPMAAVLKALGQRVIVLMRAVPRVAASRDVVLTGHGLKVHGRKAPGLMADRLLADHLMADALKQADLTGDDSRLVVLRRGASRPSP